MTREGGRFVAVTKMMQCSSRSCDNESLFQRFEHVEGFSGVLGCVCVL